MTIKQFARIVVMLISIAITYGVACMIKWATSVNPHDLDFVQVLQIVFVAFAGFV